MSQSWKSFYLFQNFEGFVYLNCPLSALCKAQSKNWWCTRSISKIRTLKLPFRGIFFINHITYSIVNISVGAILLINYFQVDSICNFFAKLWVNIQRCHHRVRLSFLKTIKITLNYSFIKIFTIIFLTYLLYLNY